MTPFNQSYFVVTFTGECPTSKLIHKWENVLDFIDSELGYTGDASVRNSGCELNDIDSWEHVDYSECGDTRHYFRQSEFAYCVGLSVTRVTDTGDLLK